MYTGYFDVFCYRTNKMSFISLETSPREMSWKRHERRMGFHPSPEHSIRFLFCFLFSLQRGLFHNIFFLMRSLPVIIHTVEIFPSLIYCYYPQFWCFVILSYFLIRPVSYTRSSLIMIPDCLIIQIWWKRWEIDVREIRNKSTHIL